MNLTMRPCKCRKCGKDFEAPIQSRHRVLCGDSTNAEDFAKLMGGQKAAMAFTDPPWNVAIGGDARLSLEREPGQNFDVLAVDAFSSDSIPVHLLTLEAFRLFFRHIRPDGILAVHVSNRHLQLEPVVERLATALGKQNILVDTEDGEDLVYGASWVLVTSQPDVLRRPALAAAGEQFAPTSLAVAVAERRGVTLCGFLREDRCTIYSHRHRIAELRPDGGWMN